jgi:hypothetical protein
MLVYKTEDFTRESVKHKPEMAQKTDGVAKRGRIPRLVPKMKEVM